MDAATIEETNRIRVSLGMKPLPVPGAASQADASSASKDEEAASTLESRQAESYENYKKHQEAEAAKKKREDRAAAIRKARDEAQRLAVLEGKGLGEEDDKGDMDAKAWLTGQKKRQKKIDKARKLEAELAAAEAAAAAAVQYTSKDLAGIKVAHDTSEFLGGEDQVLTLKDTTIDENEEEGDELENLGMREQERLGERLDLKKNRGYNPNDDEEGQGGILAQYDDEIYGKKGKKFTLDASGTIAELADILGEPAQKAGKATVSLDDIIGDAPVSSDYLAPSEIKVKKPKKKKSKGTRQKQHDEDDIFPLEPPGDSNSMDLDDTETKHKKRKAESDTFVDDDDLQASLALQRKSALKKRKKARPEDIAKQLKEEDDDAEEEANGPSEDGGLVIGEISEFVSGLSKRDDEEEKKPRRRRTQTRSPGLPEDYPMENSNDEDQPAIEEEPVPPQAEEEEAGVDEEKTIGSGMGAALSLLRERGLIEGSRDTDYDAYRSREEFLSRKRLLEEELDDQTRLQRERDRASGRLDRMSVREREDWARQQNMWRDQQQSRRMAELFSANYKPNVELRYTDDHGRSLDQKEAFKHLSHQFHGKGSGKGKTEKRLKKIEDEKRREAQSLFDAGRDSGMSAATAQQLKKRREAGVRLG
ncbi:DNA binding protein SART-1 [Pochonia chlamydosporia 170]|uniref:DNA binding protein SART-1 n=1 Tax=Pochonia chlamydosporia 170 TaxID=1380566 RepID=A0A179G5Y6_METCM|nr:DNA binding protein SART-1 [Pochonia chlamydosporia 170]OAQ72940.1 DNA binding protein SART-1 [Pochonia chlamydosporia 170]